MSSINQRLRDTIEAKKLSGRQVAIELEIDYRQFNNWLNQTKPSIEGLQKIIKHFPDVNVRWLLTGDGEMDSPELGVLMEASGEYKTKKDCCAVCAEKDKLIEELKEDKEFLKSLIASKKETGAQSSPLFGQGAKHGKAG